MKPTGNIPTPHSVGTNLLIKSDSRYLGRGEEGEGRMGMEGRENRFTQ